MERKSLTRKIIAVALAFAAVGTLGAFTHGRHHHGDPAAFLSKRVDKLLDEVKATPEQRTKILAIRDRVAAKAKAVHGDRKADLADMLAQWDAGNPDRNAVHAKIDQRAQAMQSFAHDAADALIEVHAILTPEQRAVLSKKWHARLDAK